MKKAKKTLSVLLACVLTVTSLNLPAVTAYAEPETTGSEVQLEMEDLDPSTLHVPKLGETEEGEEEPVEEITPPYAFTEETA